MSRRRSCQLSTFAIVVCFLCLATSLLAEDWPHWRGPTSNGVAPAGPAPPLTWDENTNIVWRTRLPGRGHGSPTVVGDRIFLATADELNDVQLVMAIERSTGKLIWQTPIYRIQEWPPIHPKNTHASSTVACDGRHLFVGFYSDGLIRHACLDLDGNVVWQKDTAEFDQRYPFGFAASPVVYGDFVIVAAESESETALIAYRRSDGAEVWRTERPKNSSYSSPILLNVAGRDQVLMLGGREIRSYDPDTGKDLWQAEGAAQCTGGTVTGEDDLVIGSGGYPQSETFCVKADGSAEVLWRNKQKCYEQSMLMNSGYVYAINDGGIAFCWDAVTGEEQWKERLGGPVSASPILVGDRIYMSNEKGATFVVAANPQQFELLAENKLGDDIFATPAFLDGKIYARLGFGAGEDRYEELVCIGKR